MLITSFNHVIWDFDGTILPFDSEQVLLRSLLQNPGRKTGIVKALLGRVFAWADRQGYAENSFKRLYAFCLRGLSVKELDIQAKESARHISDEDRRAIRAIHDLGKRMAIISCGTGDLSQRILKAAGLWDCFDRVEANWFRFRDNQIEGIDVRIHLPGDKVQAAIRLGIPLRQAIAIGDGMTDIPLLDQAGKAILVDRSGRKAGLVAAHGYRVARSLAEVARWLEGL